MIKIAKIAIFFFVLMDIVEIKLSTTPAQAPLQINSKVLF